MSLWIIFNTKNVYNSVFFTSLYVDNGGIIFPVFLKKDYAEKYEYLAHQCFLKLCPFF